MWSPSCGWALVPSTATALFRQANAAAKLPCLFDSTPVDEQVRAQTRTTAEVRHAANASVRAHAHTHGVSPTHTHKEGIKHRAQAVWFKRAQHVWAPACDCVDDRYLQCTFARLPSMAIVHVRRCSGTASALQLASVTTVMTDARRRGGSNVGSFTPKDIFIASNAVRSA